MEIAAGDEYILEKEQLSLKTIKSIHPVDGRFYVITDTQTGVKIGITGDTAYNGKGAEFFKGCNILIHEAALGIKQQDNNDYLHSYVQDAAKTAVEAGVKKLMLVHFDSGYIWEYIKAAKEIFKGEVMAPVKGDVVLLG